MAKKKQSAKPKSKLPPLVKFDWKKELRKDGFKISRDGKISKQVLNNKKGQSYTEKELLRRQAKTGVPAYKTKKFTKTQALNVVARRQGYKDIHHYFKIRKTDKHRVFERYAKDAGQATGLGSSFESKYKSYADTGYEHGTEEEYDLLYDLDMVGDDDIDRYTED